jgi:uncharacterized repeat protein (TIGR03803 family)
LGLRRPSPQKEWKQSVIDAFSSPRYHDGELVDPKGSLYGTTFSGGNNGGGVVFEVTQQ